VTFSIDDHGILIAFGRPSQELLSPQEKPIDFDRLRP
jgi:hypothetical protein